MLLAPELPPVHNVRIVEDFRKYSWGWNQTILDREISATKIQIDGIKTGQIFYKLFIPLELTFSWQDDLWICWAKEFFVNCIGKGKNFQESQEQWKKLVHSRFQNLYQKRPFEMTGMEQKEWSAFCKVIDINHYRNTTPITAREIGRVHWDKYSYPRSIEWISGRYDVIDLDDVPAELAGFLPGQWIETVTRRCPQTGRLIEIEYVTRIETIHKPTTREMERFWEAIEEADLPESEWDWPLSE